jgi:hypothetical protein
MRDRRGASLWASKVSRETLHHSYYPILVPYEWYDTRDMLSVERVRCRVHRVTLGVGYDPRFNISEARASMRPCCKYMQVSASESWSE